MLGNTFKGLTDEMLRWQTERLLSLETRRDEWTVYVQPKLVVEIAYNDLQESPRYPGGRATGKTNPRPKPIRFKGSRRCLKQAGNSGEPARSSGRREVIDAEP
jgi:ATP-dependent DNA ligase